MCFKTSLRNQKQLLLCPASEDGPQDGEEDTTQDFRLDHQVFSAHGPGRCTLLPSPYTVSSLPWLCCSVDWGSRISKEGIVDSDHQPSALYFP